MQEEKLQNFALNGKILKNSDRYSINTLQIWYEPKKLATVKYGCQFFLWVFYIFEKTIQNTKEK